VIQLDSTGDATSAGPGESAEEPVATSSVDTASDGGCTERGTRRRRRTPIRWLAAATVVAVLAVAGYGGWLLFERHQRDVAAQQALAAAEKFVVMLTTVDSNAIDKHVADVLDGSTGEFNDQYAKSTSGQHRQAIVDSKVTTHGRVVESAVKFATPNRVQVVLMVDQSVSSLATPEPQLDRSRIKMTMQKVDGRWLVSQVELL
jgi:Mce-associated membrane protein